MSAKISLFLLKISILNWHCAPRTARLGLFYPLIGLAAVDLAWRGGWKWHALLTGVHVVVVEIFVVGGKLCDGREWLWDLSRDV